MKTIKAPSKNISLLWRKPQTQHTVYRPMKFLLTAETKDGVLLYNVVTSEMVLLDKEEREVFDSLPAVYSSKMQTLLEGHYIVPEDFDENKSVRELRAIIKKLNPSIRVSGFTILPTTECNARCYYCFESDHKHCTMSESMANNVVEYIIKECRGEPIEIEWFGGEPLVGRNRISQICRGLRENSIKFISSMVSNAYLFDKDIISIAKNEWNLRSVQITLDGTEDVYNKTKAYINPNSNPYMRVLSNIGNLLDSGISVNVRLNVTDKNFDNLRLLIDELSELFGGRSGFSCYSHAVYDEVGFEPLTYDDKLREFIHIQTTELDAELQEKHLLGSLGRLPFLRTMNCMSDNDSCRVIYPDGNIGKCENKSSLDGIGDVFNDITDKEKDAFYKAVNQYNVCDNCCLYPYCINLSICPETGRCSETKVKWKTRRYADLMLKQYMKHMRDGFDSICENITHSECDS